MNSDSTFDLQINCCYENFTRNPYYSLCNARGSAHPHHSPHAGAPGEISQKSGVESLKSNFAIVLT